MKVIVCKPNNRAKLVDVSNELSNLQGIVNGDIEAIELGDGIYLVCNESGRMLGLEQNRIIVVDGKIADIILGTFFLCGVDGSEFTDIPSDKIELYMHLMNSWSIYWINKETETIIEMHSPVEDDEEANEAEEDDGDDETLA